VHIVLLGDSIFDNASYVSDGESIVELLSKKLPEAKISLAAVDGDVTTGVFTQLGKCPQVATHAFLSCGGNDALRSISILEAEAKSVNEALHILHGARESFRANYVAMLEAVLNVFPNVIVCTIYNKVPGLSEGATTALALYNEVILEELSRRNVPVIDLRITCSESKDYSKISPIEPSKYGGEKIVNEIAAKV